MSTTSPTPERVALASALPALVRRPTAVFPVLFRHGRAGEMLFFSALSGIYVAYAAAQAFAVGNYVGFWATMIGLVPVGATMGFIALYFAGGLLSWSADKLRGHPEAERMFAVFGYSTWVFLPLLVVIVPLELVMHGTRIFSDPRPAGPLALVWLVRLLEVATIGLWLYMMVKGTATAARISDERAADTIALSIIEIGVIFVLFAVILLISLLYW